MMISPAPSGKNTNKQVTPPLPIRSPFNLIDFLIQRDLRTFTFSPPYPRLFLSFFLASSSSSCPTSTPHPLLRHPLEHMVIAC